MHTFLIVSKNGDEFADDFEGFVIICPLCGDIPRRADIGDYVDDNIVIWCKNHGEILLCLSETIKYIDGVYESRGTFNEVLNSRETDCAVKTNKRDFVDFYKRNDFKMPNNECLSNLLAEDESNYSVFRIGVLKITDILSTGELDDNDEDNDEDDEETDATVMPKYHKVDDVCFADIDKKNICTDHDGIYLYYKGYCMQCEKHYESKIWGD